MEYAYFEKGVVDSIAKTHVHGREQDGRVQRVDLPRLDERVEKQTTHLQILLLAFRIRHEVLISSLFSEALGLVVQDGRSGAFWHKGNHDQVKRAGNDQELPARKSPAKALHSVRR